MTQEDATRDLLIIIEDAPLTFTWDGDEYLNAGTRGALIERNGFGVGGFLEEPTLSITTTRKKLGASGDLTNRFPSDVIPASGDLITVDEVQYRIDRVHLDEFDAGVLFDCVGKNTGAQ